MATKKSPKSLPLSPQAGHPPWQIQILHTDYLRIDLYNMCIPSRTGETEDGWGCATLTVEQCLELSRQLAKMATLARPPLPTTKRSKK